MWTRGDYTLPETRETRDVKKNGRKGESKSPNGSNKSTLVPRPRGHPDLIFVLVCL